MPLGPDRRQYLEAHGQPLPGRPKKRPGKVSRPVRVIATAEAFAWFLSLPAERRGELVEALHAANQERTAPA